MLATFILISKKANIQGKCIAAPRINYKEKLSHANSQYHIAYIYDSGYWNLTRISIYSLCKQNSDISILFHLFVPSVYDYNSNYAELKKLLAQYPNAFYEFHHFAEVDTRQYSYSKKYPKIILVKLFLWDYLKTLDKILYLDSDTIVVSSIRLILDTNIEGKYIAACKAYDSYSFRWINSGVVLYNLERFRKKYQVQSLTDKIFSQNTNLYDDLFHTNLPSNEIIELPYRNNIMVHAVSQENVKPIENEKNNAVILHYMHKAKIVFKCNTIEEIDKVNATPEQKDLMKKWWRLKAEVENILHAK